ncbi:MAG: DUF4396 domain-containing protein [bacterium]|nr:DUF4396 domain-containing protein [bacterium]
MEHEQKINIHPRVTTTIPISNKSYLLKSSISTFTCLLSCAIGNWGTLAVFQIAHESMKNTERYTMDVATNSLQYQLFYIVALGMLVGLIASIAFVGVIINLQLRTAWGVAFKAYFGMSFMSMLIMMATE